MPALIDWVGQWLSGLRGETLSICFPDGDDPRVRTAANLLALHDVLRPVLITSAQTVGKEESTIPLHQDVVERRAEELASDVEIGRLLDETYAPDHVGDVTKDPLHQALCLLQLRRVDACLAGATQPTSKVIKAALSVVGLSPTVKTLTSCFLMLPPVGPPIVFADCAVNPEPDEMQLAEIALASAETYEKLTKLRAVVALLSFGSKGSADHKSIDGIRRSVKLIKGRAPNSC